MNTGIPTRLSAVAISQFYDKDACARIDKVLVDGQEYGPCIAYDMEKGWAQYRKADGTMLGKIKGVVTVKLK